MTDLLQEKQTRIKLASAQQRMASDPKVSVWVEASAGTGKTKVLSDRVLRLLLSGVNPSKILCLTYTKAAAVEMSTRIADKLSKWAVISDDELKSELSKLLGEDELSKEIIEQARRLFALLLDAPGGMKIQTIHSFCQEILKRFPLEAKISPYFEVMDDRTAKEALDDIKQKLLQKIEQYPDGKTAQALAYITTKVSEFSFPSIMNALTEKRSQITRLLTGLGGVEGLIAQVAKRLGLSVGTKPEQIVSEYFDKMNIEAVLALAEAMSFGSATDQQKANVLRQSVKNRDYEKYNSIFLTTEGYPRKTIATKTVVASLNECAQEALGEAERLVALNEKIAAANLLASTTAVLYLAEDLLKAYNTFKKLNSKMDYEDLIVQTKELLENPGVAEWVLYKLDGGIDNILIDEAQDTSPDQWAIVEAITNEFFCSKNDNERTRTVFVVGDRKQSIYSFQGADQKEFEKMRLHFLSKKNEGTEFKEINLEVSFRSTAAILDAVNCIFADEISKQGVAPKGQTVWHTPSRIGEAGKVEIWPLVEAEKGENPDVWLPPVERVAVESTSSKLAKMIAEKIKKKVSEKEFLISQNRPLKYRDFMILVQRRNSFVDELVRACKNVGVEIAGADKINLLEQIAIQDLLALGKFVLLPDDDLTLAEVLKSPLFGLDDDDLLMLCYGRGKQSLWQRIKANNNYVHVVDRLKTLLMLADGMRPFEFYQVVLSQFRGREKFIARLGHEAEDGLDEFVNLTLAFEREHIPSLQMFIDWIVKDEVQIKRELEQSDVDAVRIMTVHGSKGLQAPIVILPDTVRVKDIKNEAGLLMGKDILFYPFCSSDYEQNCKKIKEDEKTLSLEEYHRLLYVALTRAEERLCICGCQKTRKASEDSWYNLCQEALKKIAVEDGEKYVYEVMQEAPLPMGTFEEKKEIVVKRFGWMSKNAPEEAPLAKPLAPSKADEENEIYISPLNEKHPEYFERGILIHKLLQFLPQVEETERIKAANEYIKKHGNFLSEYEQKKVIEEVLSLIKNPKFAPLFAINSKAEVPIMGEVDGKIICGQIDRLAVTEDKIMIVDFKTNRPAAKSIEDVSDIYIKQLRIYKRLIEKIYKSRKVETYLLWTNTSEIMLIE